MKTRLMLAAGVLCLATAVYAEQGGKKDVFWDKLQNKLEKLTPAKKAAATTAVGGVRGAKNDDAADIYWKGKDKSVEMNEEEMQKFNLAVESKLKGDNELALKHFEEFLDQYPQSAFRVEGLQAAEKIRMEIAAARAPKAALPAVAPQPAVVEAVPAAAPAVNAPAAPAPVVAEPAPQAAPVPDKVAEPAAEGQPAR